MECGGSDSNARTPTRPGPENRIHMEKFKRHLLLRNLKASTVATKLWKVRAFSEWFEFRDVMTATPDDVEEFYLARREAVSQYTVHGDIQKLRMFFEWLRPGVTIMTFKPQKPPKNIPTNLPSSEDIKKLMDASLCQRDRTLFILFWESGARLDEIMSANIGDLQFTRHGGRISVDGKTGRRTIPLGQAIPEMQAWLRVHPLRDDPHAPLFVTQPRGGAEVQRLSGHTVQGKLSHLKKQLGISRRTNPHSLRKGRLTDLSRKGFNEPDLRKIAGWSASSDMAVIYVAVTAQDLEEKLLRVNGLLEPDEEEIYPLAPVKCPRCDHLNPAGADVCCVKCSMALNEQAAAGIDDTKLFVAKDDEIQKEVIQRAIREMQKAGEL